MSTLFSHAKRHQWIADNPITEVRTSAKRQDPRRTHGLA
jgi:hypothetical protein